MKITRTLAVVLACLPWAAAADMYTWKDPQTGRTRMSNSPPQWLREGLPGPRVEVMRGNKLIDAATAFASPQEPAQMSERQRAMAGASPAADRAHEKAVPAERASGADGDEEEDEDEDEGGAG